MTSLGGDGVLYRVGRWPDSFLKDVVMVMWALLAEARRWGGDREGEREGQCKPAARLGWVRFIQRRLKWPKIRKQSKANVYVSGIEVVEM